MESGKKNILSHTLSWRGYYSNSLFYDWYSVGICTIAETDGKFVLSPLEGLKTIIDGDRTYDSFEEAHGAVLDFFKFYKEHFKKIADEVRAQNDAYRKQREEEQAKFYHLDLKDLTPESDLLHADLLSVRSLNILKMADISTLKQLSLMQRSEFSKFRNCGKNTVDELENLLTQVGLTWGMKDSQYVDSITLSALIYKLQKQLNEHPEYADRMVYFDQLHINGELSEISNNAIELS